MPALRNYPAARRSPCFASSLRCSYCNNNFTGAPESLPVKAVASALNVSTFVSLHTYGYRNVYELGPVIDVARSKLAFAGKEAR